MEYSKPKSPTFSLKMVTWEFEDLIILTISTIGFVSLTKLIFKSLKWVYCICMFLKPPKALTSYGSWALITGCTDGIGKALTFELASKGLNLVLVSRNPEKLKSTSNEISDKFGGKKTQIKIVVVDLANDSGEEIERKVRSEIEGLDVGVLINNAGSSAKGPRFFHESDMEELDGILKVNIGGINWVTKAVLPGMLKRKKGVIVNIGSGSSVIVPSFPFSTVYAATKAYVAMLSHCLSVEYKEHGINIQCQVPLYVATKMVSRSIDRTSLFVPSAEEYSRASVRWIGHDSLICIPYLAHALQAYLVSLMPDWAVNQVVFRTRLRMRNKLILQEEQQGDFGH